MRLAVPLLAAMLTACGSSESPPAGSPGLPPADPPPPSSLVLKAETVLPPGQSGFFSIAGQAQGTATGNPADFGPHVDDQRAMFWSFDAKPAGLGTKPGTLVSPIPGVEIYRDAHGVPIVYGQSVHDLWYGVGYAVAQDRLFLMDAVRRMGAGTFAELTGCGGVPADIQQRTVTYTDAEYQAMFEALSPDSKDSVQGYVDGANAWRTEVLTNPVLNLPAEYVLLTTTPAPFTVRDVLAAGVFITRFVAAEGGNEFLNIRMLRQLEAEYGSREAALDAFQDMTWLEDPKAVTSVPASLGRFSNQAEPATGRESVFRSMAQWALTLPETIWKGPGTGSSPPPAPCSQPSLPGPLGAAGGLGAGEVRFPSPARGSGAGERAHAQRAMGFPEMQRKLVLELQKLRAHLHGGSYAFAIGPSRTRDGGTLMVSGPQLGYSYPLLLVEYEIHGPGGYGARGSSVPILPVVGIGYTEFTAWGLTTGYSKTIDSVIETICSTAQQAAGTCAADQYLHAGQWKPMECRDETIPYRAASQGVPVGPAILSSVARVCRTLHGPLVARDDSAGLARALRFAMWKREIDTIDGVREWNRARSFAEFMTATRRVTWNENVTFATRDGHIGYVHPGLFPRRHPDTDMRLPIPGTGEFDFGDDLSFEELPQAIDPPQGYIANWNTRPAQGWLDGEGLGSTSRPGGPGQRVTSILDVLAERSDWTFADLREIDRRLGTTDPRGRELLPVIAQFRASAGPDLSEVQRAALDLMLGWDRVHYGPGIDIADEAATDGPAATVFGEYVAALRDTLFGGLKDNVIDPGVPDPDPNNPDAEAGLTVYGRVAGVGSHLFDQSVMDNLVLRVLDPLTSGLALRRDYTGGRSRDEVMLAALEATLARLATLYNGGAALTVGDLDQARRVHPRSQLCSLSGVIGPGADVLGGILPAPIPPPPILSECVTMPYQDRGSWVHRAGFEGP